MNIIDHLSLGVAEIDPAVEFYDAALSPLGISRKVKTEYFAAYGREGIQFVVMLPHNGNPFTAGNGCHICFIAENEGQVDAFHHEAIKSGGVCNGAPGPRPEYPIPDVYAAFVIDPFGNKLEVIHNGFASR